MTESALRQHRCCFTGHREQKLRRTERAILEELELEIRRSIAEGYSTYIAGMAYGVDIWAGEIVIRLKNEYPKLHLISAVPFPNFESRWTDEWKRRYRKLLEQADLIKYICSGYSSYSYQRRNEWMVDHSSRAIAVFNGEPSGTKNTIDYAHRRGVPVIVIEA